MNLNFWPKMYGGGGSGGGGGSATGGGRSGSEGSAEKRPIQPTPVGALRFNTDSARLEYFDGSQYVNITTDSPERHTGSTRGLSFSNRVSDPSVVNTIDLINIDTLGNAVDFGDISESDQNNGDACGNRTRGIYAGGRGPGNTNVISFVQFANLGDTQDFGDLVAQRRAVSAGSNSTRGIFIGGNDGSNSDNHIQYITISSTGDTVDFGDAQQVVWNAKSVNSPTRQVSMGGLSPYTPYTNNVEYVTMSTLGNSANFGELPEFKGHGAPICSATRGIIAGGAGGPNANSASGQNTIHVITITTLGDAVDFGDTCIQTGGAPSGASSCTRGVIMGGIFSGSYVNTISHISISSMGDAVDFGDMVQVGGSREGASNGHGGLG